MEFLEEASAGISEEIPRRSSCRTAQKEFVEESSEAVLGETNSQN